MENMQSNRGWVDTLTVLGRVGFREFNIGAGDARIGWSKIHD